MGSTLRSFQDLECWKSGKTLRTFISGIIREIPKSGEFNLIDNLRRASRSVTRNIAEGYGRFHYQENIQFCRISRGSLTEIWDDLITCHDEKYNTEEKFNEGVIIIEHTIKVLNGYISYLEKARKQYINTVNEGEEIYNTSNK